MTGRTRWFHSMGRKTLILILSFVSSCFVFPPDSFADLPGSALNQAGFGAQAQNAADAAYNALAGLATHGETVRGGSGPLINIVLNSGELICNSWIIMIHLKSKELTLRTPRLDGDELNQTLDAIRKLNELAAIVENECTEKGLIGTGPVGGGGGVTTGGGTTGGTTGGTPGGTDGGSGGGYVKPEPLPGETIADFNCRRRCQNEYDNWQREQDRADRWSNYAREKRQAADALDRSLNEGRRSLSDARTELANMIKAGPPIVSGTPNNAQIREMTTYNNRRNALNDAIKDYEKSLRDLEPKVDKAKKDADDWEKSAKEQRQRAEQAKRAYEECMRKCLAFAQSIGDHTTIVLEQVNPGIGNNPFDPQNPLGGTGTAASPTPVTPQTPGTPSTPSTPAGPSGCTTPQPPSESQTQACPAGQTGSVVQTRSYTCVGTTWTPGPYQTTSNTCTGSPPPQGCTTPQPPTESQTLSCPAGQVGTIVQTRGYTCVGSTWVPGAYQTTSNTCAAPPPTGCATNFGSGTYVCSGSCGISSVGLSVASGNSSMTAGTFGSNANVGFSCTGPSASSQSTNLIILGATGHRCTLTGLTMTSLSAFCQNTSGGTCTSTCSR